MIFNLTTEHKNFILLRLTKELIRNTRSGEIARLEEILKKENIKQKYSLPQKEPTVQKEEEIYRPQVKPIKSKVVKIEDLETKQIETKPIPVPQPSVQQQKPMPQTRPRQITIPEPKLPTNLSYLKPTRTQEKIDLKKLNPLIQDSNVRIIECTGEDERIIVIGSMGKKPTGITMSKKEIEEIIDTFSKSAKIPKNQGLFKVAFGNLILTAMVSETVSSTFVIKKI